MSQAGDRMHFKIQVHKDSIMWDGFNPSQNSEADLVFSNNNQISCTFKDGPTFISDTLDNNAKHVFTNIASLYPNGIPVSFEYIGGGDGILLVAVIDCNEEPILVLLPLLETHPEIQRRKGDESTVVDLEGTYNDPRRMGSIQANMNQGIDERTDGHSEDEYDQAYENRLNDLRYKHNMI